jgi:cytidylate kinase
MGWLYVDTGAMYRAFALKASRAGLELGDEAALGALAKQTEISLAPKPNAVSVLLDGEDVSDLIRAESIGRAASEVATVSAVRRRMVQLQQEMGKDGKVVLEGRDTTTVVFPDAGLKVYVTASLGERARRRRAQLGESVAEEQQSLDHIRRVISERDRRDESREDSPLTVAEGAIILDTTALTIDEQVEAVLRAARRAGLTDA